MIAFFERYLIQTNLWISVAAASWTAANLLLLGYFDLRVVFLTFGATLLTYNFQRSMKVLKGLYSGQATVQINARLRLVFMLLGFLCAATMALLLWKELWMWYLPLAGLAVFYVSPIGKGGKWSLRQIPGLKVLLISFTWALVVAALPAYIAGESWESIFWLFSVCFFFVFGITIPFDIRDLHYDGARLKTIPQLLGVKRAKLAAGMALLVALAISYGACMCCYSPSLHFTAAILAIVCIPLVFYSSENRSKFYYGFALDGSIILWAVVQLAFLL